MNILENTTVFRMEVGMVAPSLDTLSGAISTALSAGHGLRIGLTSGLI